MLLSEGKVTHLFIITNSVRPLYLALALSKTCEYLWIRNPISIFKLIIFSVYQFAWSWQHSSIFFFFPWWFINAVHKFYFTEAWITKPLLCEFLRILLLPTSWVTSTKILQFYVKIASFFHTPCAGSDVNALGYFNCVLCAKEGFT